jgi:hypothetical protein
MTKLAAKELQAYLEKIGGAKLEVRTAPTAGKAYKIPLTNYWMDPRGSLAVLRMRSNST